MNTTSSRLSKHHVESVVVSCIDFRFNNDLAEAVRKAFSIKEYDEIKLAGGAGNLALLGNSGRKETVLADLGLAVSAHQVKTIYLLTHQNCGAYGKAGHAFAPPLGDEEKEFHRMELLSAAKAVSEAFPEVTVRTAFVSVLPDDTISVEAL